MRISRIRKFKKSGEITIVLTRDEARALSYRIFHERKDLITARDLGLLNDGSKLGKELYFKGLTQLW